MTRRRLEILCCPDKFRGSLSAADAAAAFAEGLRACGVEGATELPLADGGEGTLDALLAARGGCRRRTIVTGPAQTAVEADWGLLPDGNAVIELAQASGLRLVQGANNPMLTTTRGVGELIAAAADAGATGILLGVGGSATVDGGSGAIDALGWELPVPVVVACDVVTRFVDAAAVFGPQKGAQPAEVDELTRRLERLAALYLMRTGIEVRDLRGGGAGGGIAGGLAALGATLRPGFDVVAMASEFAEHLCESAFVVTGEGLFDRTSMDGKVVGGVVRAAAAARIGSAVIAGAVESSGRALLPTSVPCIALSSLGHSTDDSMARARELIVEAIAELASLLTALN